MEFLTKDGELREAKSFDQIDVGRYKLVGLRFFTTRYETRLVAVTDDFEIFLPRKFSELIDTPEYLDVINENIKEHPRLMIYGGMTDGDEDTAKVHFEVIEESSSTDSSAEL